MASFPYHHHALGHHSHSYHHQGIMASFQRTEFLLRQPTCEVISQICLVVDLTHSIPFHIFLQGLAFFGWSQPWSSSFPYIELWMSDFLITLISSYT